MIDQVLNRLMARMGRIGSDPRGSDEVRLPESLLASTVVRLMVVSVAWTLLYSVFGEVMAASIPFAYIVISAISILIYRRTHQYRLFAFSQLLLTLLIPFLLTVIL